MDQYAQSYHAAGAGEGSTASIDVHGDSAGTSPRAQGGSGAAAARPAEHRLGRTSPQSVPRSRSPILRRSIPGRSPVQPGNKAATQRRKAMAIIRGGRARRASIECVCLTSACAIVAFIVVVDVMMGVGLVLGGARGIPGDAAARDAGKSTALQAATEWQHRADASPLLSRGCGAVPDAVVREPPHARPRWRVPVYATGALGAAPSAAAFQGAKGRTAAAHAAYAGTGADVRVILNEAEEAIMEASVVAMAEGDEEGLRMAALLSSKGSPVERRVVAAGAPLPPWAARLPAAIAKAHIDDESWLPAATAGADASDGEVLYGYAAVDELATRLEALWAARGGGAGPEPVDAALGAASHVEVAGFFHVGLFEGWRAVADDQMATAWASGLLNRSARVVISAAGPGADALDGSRQLQGSGDPIAPGAEGDGSWPWAMQPNAVVLASRSWLDYEFPALTAMRCYCRSRPQAVVWYAQAKGSSSPSPLQTDWRRQMDYYVLERWQDCLNQLVNHGRDTCGALGHAHPIPHYSGNFFWATCAHVRRLDDPVAYMRGNHWRPGGVNDEERWMRYWAEFWIGSSAEEDGDYSKMANCYPNRVNHYEQRYPREAYEGESLCTRRRAAPTVGYPDSVSEWVGDKLFGP